MNEPADSLTLFLTSACNLACPYCFAEGLLRPAGAGRRDMTLAEVRAAVDFFFGPPPRAWGMIKIAGGEPTLNPEFGPIVAWLANEGYRPWIFTNGVWPARVLDGILRAHGELAGKIQFLVNYNAGLPDPQRRRLDRVCRTLASRYRVCLGVNLPGPDRACLAMINRCREMKISELRFGIAQPVGGQAGRVPFGEYPAVGRVIAELARRADAAGIRLWMDCSHPPCLFRKRDRELIEALVAKGSIRRYEMNCWAPLVVGPEGRIWRCFRLSDVAAGWTLESFGSLDAARSWFDRRLEHWDVGLGADPKCERCRDRLAGACKGGCPGFHDEASVERRLAEVLADPGRRVLRIHPEHVRAIEIRDDGAWIRAAGRRVQLQGRPWIEVLRRLDGRRRLGPILREAGLPRGEPVAPVIETLIRSKVLQVVR